MAKRKDEKGQAAVIMVLALSLVLVGGLGLVVDGARLYNVMQMAQVAADAAATASAMSIFQGTNTGATFFPISGTYTCSSGTDTALPCQYARMNGFGSDISKDTVTVDFPTCTGTPDPCGYQSMLAVDLPAGTPTQVRVTIRRTLGNSIIRMLGAGPTTPVQTSAIAAIVSVESPTPIIITDPWNAGSLTMTGNVKLTVCGGPSQSIQVNSTNIGAYSPPSSGYIDLSKGGPKDINGDCTQGTGSNFGNQGGPQNWGSGTVDNILLGTTGLYMSRKWIPDPFRNVPAPGETIGLVTGPNIPGKAPAPFPVVGPSYGCPTGVTCTVFSPGRYGTCATNCQWAQPGAPPNKRGFNFDGVNYIIFKPGLYYVQGGGVTFKNDMGAYLPKDSSGHYLGTMCTDATLCPADTDTGQGMVIYDTGDGDHNGGGFVIDTLAFIYFTGPTLSQVVNGYNVPIGPYYGLTLWEDRASTNFMTHTLGQGNGCFQVIGTVYITPTRDYMVNHVRSSYQVADYHGTPCSATITKGDIIVSDLLLNGTAAITMNLFPVGYTYIDQVALVGGGPHP